MTLANLLKDSPNKLKQFKPAHIAALEDGARMDKADLFREDLDTP